ncbi:MAG: site-specific integrase, partial [Cytophagaceae bacterium]
MAQAVGVLPEEQALVSRGHKIFSKSNANKSSATNGYKVFMDDELRVIFQTSLLSEAERPADFWLPMLGLFTGGRISELTQLDIVDIQKHGDVWAISINDEGDESVKTLAADRLIPLHPTFIDCGFLEYVNDAKEHGTKLLSHLTSDTFGSWGATLSKRWGKHLDKFGIKDKQKVFHSFRSTSNDKLKQNGVPDESRCQFIGHEHDTVNSSIYSNPDSLPCLLEHVAKKLDYPGIDLKPLKYQPHQLSKMLAHLCAKNASMERHRKAKAARLGT